MTGELGGALLVGGQTGATVLSDGWMWQGSTFDEVSNGPTPPARTDASLASWGNGAVLFGGQGADGGLLRDTWLWDGHTWSLASSQSSPSARRGHVMTRLGNEVVLFGGLDEHLAYLRDTWTWDGLTWTLRTPPEPSPAASAFGAIAVQGSVAVHYGGLTDTSVDGQTFTWDGNRWTLQQGFFAGGPLARHHFSLTQCGNDVVAFGGFGGYTAEPFGPLADTWIWDGTGWTQKFPTTSPPARYGHGAAALR